MVQKPPLKLKLVAPYILRGIELETIDPIIAYYCKDPFLRSLISQNPHGEEDELTRTT